MSSWDYRVIWKNGRFAVHHVRYNDRNEIFAWSPDPVYPDGETMEVLQADMQYTLEALEQPVVRYKDLPEGEPDESTVEMAREAYLAFKAEHLSDMR